MNKPEFDKLLKEDDSFRELVDGLLILTRKYLKLQVIMLDSAKEDFDLGGVKYNAFLEIVQKMNPYIELQMNSKGQELMLNYLKGD